MFNMQHTLVNIAIKMQNLDKAEQHVAVLFDLAETHKQFSDFAFFSYYNAGLLAYHKGNFFQSNAHFKQALALKMSTKESHFIHISYEYLIIGSFRLSMLDEVKSLILTYKEDFPDHKIKNLEVSALIAFSHNNFFDAFDKLYQRLDQEISQQHDFIQHSILTKTALFDDSITELDNIILQQELKINALNFEREHNKKWNAYLVLGFVSGLSILLMFIVWHLVRTRRIFIYRSQTDHLTRIANRRHSFETGEVLLQQADSRNQSMSLLMFDIDHFKKVNDTLGHEVGDKAIQLVVQKSKECLRRQDHIGRIGGEEFMLLLPNTGELRAKEIAERVRLNITTASVGKGNDLINLSVSIGVACATDSYDLKKMMEVADKALYQAKNLGRNRVVVG